LRPVGPADEALLLELYASTRADEMAMVPWTPEQREAFIRSQYAARQDHYQKNYPTATHHIIMAAGREVGHLYVGRMEREIRIVDITLLPIERNVGVGTFLIEELLHEAARTAKALTIYVEEFNPSRHLFERLGFHQDAQHGMYVLMKWVTKSSTDNDRLPQ
jgi:GNAT superfamily N-acetyltransferase